MTVAFALNLLLAAVALLVAVRYFALPIVKLEYRRRRSRDVKPEVGQVWAQDDAVLWVVDVDQTGVWFLSTNAGNPIKWQDTWEQWHARLKNRAIWYTGRRQPPP